MTPFRGALPSPIVFLAIAGVLSLGVDGTLAQRPLERADARPDLPAGESDPADGVTPGTEPGGFFPEDETDLIPELHHLILVGKDGTGREQPGESSPSVEDQGAGAPDEVLASLERYLGHPVSLSILNEMARTVVSAYRKNDRPVVDVFFPEQEITGGVVRIHAVEAVLGEVKLEGAEHSDPDYLVDTIRTSPGEPILASSINGDIDWLNRYPLRSVALIYEKGVEEGTSDVVLTVDDAKPFHFFSTIANTGLELTGENEWSIGILGGHIPGLDGFFSYNFTTDLDFNNLQSNSLYYKTPLPWRHELELFGSHVITESEFQLDGVGVGSGGVTTQAGGGYIIPLPALTRGRRHDVTLGVDYKSTNSDLAFGGAQVFDMTAAVFQIRAEYGVTVADKWGHTAFEFAGILSPGRAFGNNDDASFGELNGGANSEYWYGRASLERLVLLPKDFRFSALARGQWSPDRLIPTEQQLIGGVDTVRGYDPYVFRGDRGLVLNLELEGPTQELPPVPGTEFVFTASPFLFYDAGWVETAQPVAGESSVGLQSVGFGTRMSAGERTQIEAGYGWGVDFPSGDPTLQTGKQHFSVRSRF